MCTSTIVFNLTFLKLRNPQSPYLCGCFVEHKQITQIVNTHEIQRLNTPLPALHRALNAGQDSAVRPAGHCRSRLFLHPTLSDHCYLALGQRQLGHVIIAS